MIGIVMGLIAAGVTAWLFRRRVARRAEAAAQGDVIRVPCLLMHPGRPGRWLRGRLLIGPGTVEWKGSTRAGAALALPAGLRQVGMRSPSLREAMKLNGGARIVECASAEGAVLIAVLPNELGHVLGALTRAA
ncbi:hypothetical protein N0X72_19860 [Streptomyces carpaticus]|uniref:DUF2550 family protein n=2 Tax=Streptomyces harbinensis TaxID=1176198 RepID=A0A1I6U5H6_9ACTN|nr:hypothetical protein [Streptomyces harbinensis]UWM51074.1 hypothetical protein N0X72_19860 [Streptomyces carpaticus]SFS96517.1 hypothetical protein SAMN05444716_105282 [Streptomyces harbinensis]